MALIERTVSVSLIMCHASWLRLGTLKNQPNSPGSCPASSVASPGMRSAWLAVYTDEPTRRCGLRYRGPDWRATEVRPTHETRWSAVENRVMSRPVSAMIALASFGLTPGISASRSTAGSTAASGPGSADGPSSALTPQLAGDGVQRGLDLVLDGGGQPVQSEMCSRWRRMSVGW
jgi:hypothetical protein